MPAAAVDARRKRWRTKQGANGYLFSHKALAKVFRAKVLAGIAAAGLKRPACYPKQWVVDCKSVGTGEKALASLGRYLYRGVIREKDIVACGNGQVSFRYRNARTSKTEVRTVTGAQFLWLVLQHVLPKGLRRARNVGFLHPNCKRLIALLHVLLKFVSPPSGGRGQATAAHLVPLLWRHDEDRADMRAAGTDTDCRTGEFSYRVGAPTICSTAGLSSRKLRNSPAQNSGTICQYTDPPGPNEMN